MSVLDVLSMQCQGITGSFYVLWKSLVGRYCSPTGRILVVQYISHFHLRLIGWPALSPALSTHFGIIIHEVMCVVLYCFPLHFGDVASPYCLLWRIQCLLLAVFDLVDVFLSWGYMSGRLRPGLSTVP